MTWRQSCKHKNNCFHFRK